MAVIKPFRGVRYNLARFEDMRVVVSQPYDRISADLQRQYHALSPYNITRIILGHLEDDCVPPWPDGSEAYACARRDYQQWLANGILVREDRPALYAYEQRFSANGARHTRLGLIAAVELADFSEGIILPHERTHNGPKADRLRLLETLQVNPEQVFLLYPDPENRVNALIRQAIADAEPDIDVVEIFENQVRQRVWIITDPEVIQAIQRVMAPKRRLIIADGHHRYETALTYRDGQRRASPTSSLDAAFSYVSATLISMDDPGLVVLPTHREIRGFTATSPATLLARARQHFAVAPAPDLTACLDTINARPDGHAFGFYGGQQIGFHVLTLKDDALIDRLIVDDRPRAWKMLDVTVLHRVLLEQIAEVPAQGIEDKSLVRYHRDAQEAVDSVDRDEGNFVFFLRPTSIDQIKACAALGQQMPQKSTDFYPKMIAGLTMLPVGPGETLAEPILMPELALHP